MTTAAAVLLWIFNLSLDIYVCTNCSAFDNDNFCEITAIIRADDAIPMKPVTINIVRPKKVTGVKSPYPIVKKVTII